MEAAWRIKTTVLPGGRIEIADPHLPTGQAVDVIVLFPEAPVPRRSILDVLADAPGGLIFHMAEEVETYLRTERESWER